MLDERSAFHDLDVDALRARRGTKWRRYGPDVLAAWVADMDFPVAPVVAAALHEAVDRSDLGYPQDGAACGVAAAFAARSQARSGWSPDPDRVLVVPDVMRGVELALLAATSPGDGVLVTTPVYPPFLRIVPGLGRRLVEVPLGGDGRLDLEALARAFAAERPAAVLLCHPHNPSGRVFDADERRAVADLCAEHGTTVVSDEIHGDLTLPGTTFVPFAALDGDTASRTVTVTSASKAFNLAGLRCAVVASGRDDLHARVCAPNDMVHEAVGTLGVCATLAAWTPAGDEWLAACTRVLDANARHATARLMAEAPGLVTRRPEATYLLWLDCRGLGLGDDPSKWFLRQAKVALSRGLDFGAPGAGFARLNVATSPTILDLVIDRMVRALGER